MKKRLKLFSLSTLSVLFALFTVFAATFAGGAKSVKADNTIEITSFKMVSGAAVRLSDDNGLDNAGIRFSAVISESEYKSLAESYTVEAGMFIMPEFALKYGDLNYDTCFKDGHFYQYGEGATENVIIHMEARPYLDTLKVDGVDFTGYRINGSVVKMLDKNLDVPYIARAYLKLTNKETNEVTYEFAETDYDNDARSVLQVAQNGSIANLNKTGEETEKENATFEAYFNAYLAYKNDGVSIDYKEEIYKETLSGFELCETKDRNASIESLTTEISRDEKYKGYDLVPQMNETTDYLLVSSNQTVKSYYALKTQDKDRYFDLTKETDVSKVITSSDGRYSEAIVTEEHAYGGSKALKLTNNCNSWLGFANNENTFSSTKTVSFMLYTEDGLEDVQIWFSTDAGDGYYKDAQGNQSVTLAKGFTKITYTHTQAITCVKSIQIKPVAPANYNPTLAKFYYVSDFVAERELEAAAATGNKKLTATTAKADVTPDIYSTVYSSEDLGGGVKVSYRALKSANLGQNEFTALTADENGKYEIAVSDKTDYEVKTEVNGLVNSYYVLGYYGQSMWADFDNEAENAVPSKEGFAKVSNANSIDGGNAFAYVGTVIADWYYAQYSAQKDLGGSYGKVCFWAYVPENFFSFTENGEEMTGEVYYARVSFVGLNSDAGWVYSDESERLQFKPGWNYYELSLGKAVTSVSQFGNVPQMRYVKYKNGAVVSDNSEYNSTTVGLVIDRIAFKN